MVLTLLLAGCGGGSDDSGDGGDSVPSELTKAEYVERADSICQQLYEQRDPLEIQAAKAAQAGDREQGASVFDNAADVTDNRLDEIEALPVPAGDEKQVQAILGSGGTVADSARAAAEAIRDDDVKALAKESTRGRTATQQFNKRSIAYGFLVCGRGQSAQIG